MAYNIDTGFLVYKLYWRSHMRKKFISPMGMISGSTEDYAMPSYLIKDFAKIHRNSCKRTGFKCIINSI